MERRDLDAAIRCIAPGVYFVSPTEGADFCGCEGFRRWWDLQVSSGSEFHPLQIEALDDRHVFAELLHGRPEDGGTAWVTETVGWMYTVGKGAIQAIELFEDAERARERALRARDLLRRNELPQAG